MEYCAEIERKIKKGLMVRCECGRAHFGKTEKCQQCSKVKCQSCGKGYIKGTTKLCIACERKRLRKIANGF
jgi:hypothetical protein